MEVPNHVKKIYKKHKDKNKIRKTLINIITENSINKKDINIAFLEWRICNFKVDINSNTRCICNQKRRSKSLLQ